MRLEFFQLIDRIAALSLEDRTIRAEAKVPIENTIFEGHFPDHPILPGVLLIEAMAQTAGWLVVAATNFKSMVFLVQVKEAKFRNFVVPGDELSVTAKLVHEGSGYAVCEGAIERAGQPIANAELRLRLMPFPDDRLRAHMRALATRLELPSEALANG
jgi:3-hydroxyacyl-[acyl-carrier-protein] dehydratase